MQKPAWSRTARTGPMRKYVDLSIFACEGLIAIVDNRPGHEDDEFSMVTPADLAERVKALNKTYRGVTRSMLNKSQRQQEDRRLAGSQAAMECIKEAKFMGDPNDPAVQAYWARHRRSSTIKVSFSPGCNPSGYPALPIVPLGEYTGRTAASDGPPITKAAAAAHRQATHLHKAPVKKNRAGIVLLD